MRNNEEMFARRGNKLYIHADSLNKSKLVAYSDVEEICFCDNLIKEIECDSFEDMVNLKKINFPGESEYFENIIKKGDNDLRPYHLLFAHQEDVILDTIDDEFNINVEFMTIEIDENW